MASVKRQLLPLILTVLLAIALVGAIAGFDAVGELSNGKKLLVVGSVTALLLLLALSVTASSRGYSCPAPAVVDAVRQEGFKTLATAAAPWFSVWALRRYGGLTGLECRSIEHLEEWTIVVQLALNCVCSGKFLIIVVCVTWIRPRLDSYAAWMLVDCR